MKLSKEGLKSQVLWQEAGVTLPSYDIEAVCTRTKEAPIWVHFGAGNIFRQFIGGVQDSLLNSGKADKGIICVETFDYDIIDKIYAPYDNLVLGVTLNVDGSTEKKVIGSLVEGIKAQFSDAGAAKRLKEIFTNPSLQMVSYTITEKGYALTNAQGNFFPFIAEEMEKGPEAVTSAMGITCALLYERFKNGAMPIAIVSMDNCSHNGEKLQKAVVTMAEAWVNGGLVEKAFLEYLQDETKVSFPWSMIDKITPRPSENVAADLEKLGVENMAPIITSRNTYIAPFVNAEKPQYLVIEDKFPNGRPALEEAGVYFTDRKTVNEVERMKVTTCLNPLHTGLAVYGCLLGYTKIADEMKDAELTKLVQKIGPVEGMPVVTDPKILSPEAFVKEVIEVRLPNPFMPDAPQRIACDTSQKVGIRFGETIKSYAKQGKANELVAIPLAIAGWCRYLLAVDDNGEKFELSSDPMLPELCKQLEGIEVGKVDSYKGQLKPILSNANIFGSDLYEVGLGEKIEDYFKEEIQGVGAVRNTLKKYL